MRCESANGGEHWQTRKNSRKTELGSIDGAKNVWFLRVGHIGHVGQLPYWPTRDKMDKTPGGDGRRRSPDLSRKRAACWSEASAARLNLASCAAIFCN